MPENYSLKERLILANQFEILANFHEEGSYNRKYYENRSEIFRSGYTWAYQVVEEHFSDELTMEECRFVLDVLSMYSSLYYSRQYNDEDPEQINEDDILFKGFDVNSGTEVRYYSFMKFLIEDFDRFTEFKQWADEGKIELNSHGSGPSMDRLRSILAKSKEIDELRYEENRDYYTNAEILDIINTR